MASEVAQPRTSDLAERIRFWSTPLLCALLGICLIGGLLAYTALTWHRRVTLESERGVSAAALVEIRIDEILAGVTATMRIIADQSAEDDDWVASSTRAARAGGRIGSASLLNPIGQVVSSTNPRNIGLMLEPEEFGGGWNSARFGVGRLFRGRDLNDRRSVVDRENPDFLILSVPAPFRQGAVVATLSLRNIHVSLNAVLEGSEGLGIALFWRDGRFLYGLGEGTPDATPPAEAWRVIGANDRWEGMSPTGAQLACRTSASNPFILCAAQAVSPLSAEWFGWPGLFLGSLIVIVCGLTGGAVRVSNAQWRGDREQALLRGRTARSERRLSMAIEASDSVVWEYDPSRRAIRYFGQSSIARSVNGVHEEVLDDFLARLRPEDADTLRAGLGPNGRGASLLARVITPTDGWLRITAQPDVANDLGFTGIIEDVTDVVEANERYRSIFNEIAQPILLLDDDGRIEDANPAAILVFGHDKRGMRIDALIQPAHPDGEAIAKAGIDGRDALSEPNATFVGQRADGGVFPLSVSLGALTIAGARKQAVVVRDLSAETEIRNRLQAAKDASDRAAAAKSAFLSTMSHEIRTPLSGVIGTAGLLAETALDDTQHHYVTVMRESADHLLHLINDILDLSKLESDAFVLEDSAFEIGDLVRGSAGLLSASAGAKSIAVGVTIAPDVPVRVRGDAGRLRQVLLNLVGNAIKFTKAGRVDVSVSVVGGDLSIVVADTGIGIPRESLALLFDEFVQLDATVARRFGGTGLGLAICRKILARMGGRIWAESAVGEGSRFHIALPLRPDVAEVPRAGEAALPDLRSLSVLVAEDNATNQLIARSMLERLGHRVRIVENGREAVEAVDAEQFDIVLMDVMMPEMDGLAATRAIRSRTGFETLPILAVSANVYEHDRDACLSAGMSGFLAKPFNRKALTEALTKALPP